MQAEKLARIGIETDLTVSLSLQYKNVKRLNNIA